MEKDDSIPCCMCSGIYRRKLFSGVIYQEDIHHFEDYLMQVCLVSKSNSVVTTTEQFYHYRIREWSANHVCYNKKMASCLLIADKLKTNGIVTTRQQYADVNSYFISQCYFARIISPIVENYLLTELKSVVLQNIVNILISKSIKITHKIAMLTYPVWPKMNVRIFSKHVVK